MSDINDKILEFVKSEKGLTKISNVGEKYYRVNTYKKIKNAESLITTSSIDRSYYLMVDNSGSIHNLTKESKVKVND